MHQIDRRIGLQQVAPHPLAGMRLARNQQHPQPVAHARHRHHGAVVLQRQFGRAGRGRQFDHILAAMGDGHLDVGVLAHRHDARAESACRRCGHSAPRWSRRCRRDRRPAARIIRLLARRWRSARRSTTVSLRSRSPLLAGDQHLQRRVQVQGLGRGASCTSPSVIRMAPATRSGGTSASAALSAAKAWVPLLSPSAVVVTLVSRTIRSRLLRQQALDLGAAPLPPAAARSPDAHALGAVDDDHRHIRQAALLLSCTSSGLASANSRTAKASPRAQAPRARM